MLLVNAGAEDRSSLLTRRKREGWVLYAEKQSNRSHCSFHLKIVQKTACCLTELRVYLVYLLSQPAGWMQAASCTHFQWRPMRYTGSFPPPVGSHRGWEDGDGLRSPCSPLWAGSFARLQQTSWRHRRSSASGCYRGLWRPAGGSKSVLSAHGALWLGTSMPHHLLLSLCCCDL